MEPSTVYNLISVEIQQFCEDFKGSMENIGE